MTGKGALVAGGGGGHLETPRYPVPISEGWESVQPLPGTARGETDPMHRWPASQAAPLMAWSRANHHRPNPRLAQ